MRSSQSSSSVPIDKVEGRRAGWLDVLTWTCRLLVGGIFIFSGFAKGIDPWGTIYKFHDYLGVFGLDVPSGIIVTCVFLLSGYEFLTGIFLFFGCYRHSAPWMAALLMIVMLPLTLWIAIMNPVADCGCFGEALILSNWATFWKNVVISAAVLWLIRNNKSVLALISPAFQWLGFVAAAAYIMCINWYGFQVQPMIDFRHYNVGTHLIEADDAEDEQSFIFIYEKDGVKKEFADTDALPSEDAGWTFVERRDILPDKSKLSQTREFVIWDRDGEETVTSEAIDFEGRELLLLIPSIDGISASSTWRINALYDWAEQHDISMVAIVGAGSGDIDIWEDLSLPKYEIYSADDTAIKELARGNPAVVYLDKGIIGWKTSLASLNPKDFEDPSEDSDITRFAPDGESTLKTFTALFIAILAVLIAISFIPRLGNLFIINRRKDNR